MKKIMRKAAVVAAIFGMGTTVTSCDSESISQWVQMLLPTIIQVLTPSTAEPSKTFVGEWESECLTRTDTLKNDWSYYNNSSDKVKVESVTCNLITQAQTSEAGTTSTEVYVSIPSLAIAGTTYTNLEMYCGTFNTTDNTTGTFSTSNNFYNIAADNIPADATCYYACVSNGKITANEISFEYNIVAGYCAYNGKYVGALQQSTEE